MMIKEIARIVSSMRISRKIGYYILRFNQYIWEHLPESVLKWGSVRSYGRMLNDLIKIRDLRNQNPWTFFFRNRAEMDFVYEIVNNKPKDSNINILVLACSVGMEVYSLQWKLKELKSMFKIQLSGLELLEKSLEIAKKGKYPLVDYESHMVQLTDNERNELFTIQNNVACVQPELKENIKWYSGNACDAELVDLLGEQDIVIANRFLCHMYPEDAERCLSTILKLVAPGGYLFVTGVDLDVRQKVMKQSGFEPVSDHLEEIHNGDCTLHRGWPWTYWGLEPISHNADDYLSRYAMVYKRNQ